ncbi:MAG: alpha-2-macroglobulin, partial [Saprospiraceae bacterium]|nr:alpha-2-macroglobulin [Saprospiraceae bacterium]
WLLKNKQTNHWKTSKSTAAAIYALLLQGESGDISLWVTESVQPQITIGKEIIKNDPRDLQAGTGYFKKVYISDAISKDLATVKIKNDNTSVAWGAAYYQYFEQLDKIKTFADTPLKLDKKLYKVIITSKGDKLEEIKSNTPLKSGDKLKVRIELRVDRQMEYVHMKDMRASGFEPINVISEYKYQGQLGYYETTKDLATHFYFSYLPKGTFVFEYPLTVVHHGDFSGGVTSIESMYAPEYSSHSEGIRVKVK